MWEFRLKQNKSDNASNLREKSFSLGILRNEMEKSFDA
jgi:hypothetical protein